MSALSLEAGPLSGLATRLKELTGWRRYGLAALAGALATASLPPFHVLPLLLVSFPLLLWLLQGAGTAKRTFWVGWFFAFGHHVPGLYWISVALFVDIGRFWFMLPPAVLGLPALLAVFVGLGCLLHRGLVGRFGLGPVASLLVFALCWAAMEWLRGHVFTGFPWNLIGYGWWPVKPVLQAVSVTGIYGLSLLTVLLATLPALAVGANWRRPAAAGLAGLVLLSGWGGWRMAGQGLETVPGVTLRVVQPNIPQTLKWDPNAKLNNVRQTINLSAADGWEKVSHIIWPETAIPYFLQAPADGNDSAVLAQTVGRIAPAGGLLITGAPRVGKGADGAEHYYNSLFALDAGGAITATFDKFHLVPFGEYLPLRDFLPAGINAVAASASDFSPGPGPQTLTLPGLPSFSPLICYEVIFPGHVARTGESRPHWLLNLTNDAWYGNSTGPYQHFTISAVRAVEEGVPMVRAANTGISGVVDAYGRVTARLGLGETGHLDAALPVAAPVTPYARFGDGMLALLMALVAGLAVLTRRVR
ncbi:apolipoprotein N-acyltransferase [Niveispirillum sp. SYP-B3756]|uniref:apolipoprotein N-acyltransferase n=1 Tax=Niveispirillum sp. SYP-B3756 TaxID=2662178 RepID=UPI001290D32E|nr:apolipoprotein N-acyltransferase [Niveispirillum sp. SYP-B3756]MQP67018.1 apolipoprotein N-acyltransferase [Niveispirillum sp. SYP-B3756]